MKVTLSLPDARHLEAEVVRFDERPEKYTLDLDSIEESSRDSIVGGFLLGLLRFKNLHLFGGDTSVAHKAVEDIAKVGLPETDYLRFLSLTQRAQREKDETLLIDAEHCLNRSASAGFDRARESLANWEGLRRGIMFSINGTEDHPE